MAAPDVGTGIDHEEKGGGLHGFRLAARRPGEKEQSSRSKLYSAAMPDAAPPPPPAPAAVEEVTVRAHRLADNDLVPVFGETVVRPDGRPRLDEALKTIPGVSLFRRNSSLGANPTTQGLSLRAIAPSGAGRTLVLLDNVPQNDPFGGWVIWSALPGEAVESIAVLPGSGTGRYGAGALTGVVDISEHGRDPAFVAADASAGERGYGRIGAARDLTFRSGDLLLAGSAERSDGWTPVRAGRGPVDAPLGLDARAASARLGLDAGDGTVATRLFGYDETRGTGVRGGRAEASGWGVSSTWVVSPQTDAGYGWRAQAWYRASDFSQVSMSVAPGRASATPANAQDATPAEGVGFNVALMRKGPAWAWEVGADLRASTGETQERFRFLGTSFTRRRVAGGSNGVAGFYAEGAHWDGPWALRGGLRLDGWKSWDASRRERDLGTGAVTFAEAPGDRAGVVSSGRLAVSRQLPWGLTAEASTYTSFRPPTLNELHRPFRVGNDVTESNPALEPERLYGAQFSIGKTPRIETLPGLWRATVFFNRLEDPITNVTIGAGPGTFPRAGFIPAGGVLRQRQNAGRVDATGLELQASDMYGSGFWWSLSLSATDARVDGGSAAPQLTGLRPAQAPALTVGGQAGWVANERFSLSGSLRWESRRYEDDLNTRVLGPAVTVDATATWRLGDGYEFYVAADNLFDAAVETGETADGIESFGEPRTLRVGLRLRRDRF